MSPTSNVDDMFYCYCLYSALCFWPLFLCAGKKNFLTEEMKGPGAIRFNRLVGAVKTAENILEEARNAVVANVESLDGLFARVNNELMPLAFMRLVAVEDDKRKEGALVLEMIENWKTDIYARKDIYDMLRRDSAKSATQRRYLRDFEVKGATHATEDIRDQVRRLQKELSAAEAEFARNIAEDSTEVLFSRDDLEGMDEPWLESLKRTPDGGLYIVTLAYPHLFPLLRNAKRKETRKRMWEANAQKAASTSNIDLLPRIVELRKRKAELLGFRSDSELCFSQGQRMIDLSDLHDGLLEGVWERTKGKRDEELRAMREVLGDEVLLESWDVSFAQNLVQERAHIDHQRIREYLPADAVISGTMQFYSSKLGLRFDRDSEAETWSWHESVQCFTVWDAQSERYLGRFYLDLFPRKGKFSHAACFWLTKKAAATNDHATACVVANFSPPQPPDRPSLFLFSEAKTFFHEFGHLMHCILCSNGDQVLNWEWTSVEMDFLEVPSMAFEKFIYETLPSLSRHYKTGDPLPREDIERLERVRHIFDAWQWARLIAMSKFDLLIHGKNPPDARDWNTIYASLIAAHTTVPHPVAPVWCAWTHPVQGYNSSYYSYLASEIVAADIYKHFDGPRFRKDILEKGSSEKASVMIESFLGRKYNMEAFLEGFQTTRTMQ